MQQAYLEIGVVVGTHGIRGELRVNPSCDAPEFFKQFHTLYLDPQGHESVGVLGVRPHKNLALLRLEGVDSMESAEALRNRRLFFRRADAQLEEGRYFIAELLDCEVFDFTTGEHYGPLVDVSSTKANDVWHIRMPGRELLIPVIPDVVRAVDTAAGRIEITLLPGLLD